MGFIDSKLKIILFTILSTLSIIKSVHDVERSEEKSKSSKVEKKPNIILIIADDLGFNDVSFRGQNFILTPNIDALAYHGTILNKYYVPPMCTPSRTALMTGKYPIKTGMQHIVIDNSEPWGLCPNEKLMSHIFKEAGYSTNIIGKWHLGFFKESYTPTLRGFDYHYGYMGGLIDYWSHSYYNDLGRGHDFWVNRKHLYKNGSYATDLITDEATRVILNHNTKKQLFMIINHLAPHSGNDDDPMQAPPDEINKVTHIKDMNKRIYAAMINKLDQSIEKIIEALNKSKLLENSIIIYYSDNGAPTIGKFANSGSNYPLRGQKNSPWEGGIRSSAVIWSPLLTNQSKIWNEPIHAVDWLPTLLGATGIKIPNGFQIDGRNLWNEISNGQSIGERSILHNIDEIYGYSSYMRGEFKYINGSSLNGIYDNWISKFEQEFDPRTSNYSSIVMNTLTWKILQNINKNKIDKKKVLALRSQLSIECPNLNLGSFSDEIYACEPLKAPCLFNVYLDPCEKYNLANIPNYKAILETLKSDVEKLKKVSVPSVRQLSDPASKPSLYNGQWTWWKNENDKNKIPGTYCQ